MATGLYIAMDFKPTDGSGIAEHTHQMARHLTELGEHISVLTPSRPGDEEFDKKCGYPVTRFDIGLRRQGGNLISRLRRDIIVMGTILRTAFRIKPNYTILDRWDYISGLSVIFASTFSKCPFFVFAHRAEFSENLRWKRLRRMTLRLATKVICVSDYTRSLILADGIKPSKTTTIYNGFDTREIEKYRNRRFKGRFPNVEYAFSDGGHTVLSVSRLIGWKRIDRIIEAMPIIVSKIPDARYVVVGSGMNEPHLRRLAASMSARDSITFLGPLTGDEKFECFDRCDVFALPSEGEGFGIVFTEAMGFGKPIIGGRSGGALEAIAHGENGLLVNSNSVEEIADAVIRLLKNPDEARKLGENGRQRVENELNWKASAGKFLSLINHALNERK